MKKIKLPILALALLLCFTVLAACNKDKNDKVERQPEYITVLADSQMSYRIVRPDNASQQEEDAGVLLRNAFKEKFSVTPDLSTDWIKRGETLEEGLLEILIGDTNRPESEIVKASLSGEMYAVVVLNNKIVICASSDEYINDAVQYFIDTFIKTAEEKVVIESTTNLISVKTSDGWLQARTLEIQIVATPAGGNSVEIIAAVNEEDFVEMGYQITSTSSGGADERVLDKLSVKGATYTVGDVTYKAADYGKSTLVSATLDNVDATTLTQIEITPYVMEFGETIYGLNAYACAYNGSCETISTVEIKEKAYQITNPAELYVIADYVNKGNRVLSADLTCDVDLGGMPWTPIASDKMSFKGTFNGNSHTVSGLYVNSANTDCVGFFGCIGSESVVKDVNFSNAYVFANNNSKVGVVAGENRGLITGCNVVSGNISTTDKDKTTVFEYKRAGVLQGIGGLVGVLNGKYLTSVENSTFAAEINVKGKYVNYVGGIAGKSVAISGDIVNCVSSGKINCVSDFNASNAKEGTGVGGIVGSVVNGLVSGCEHKGTVNGSGETVGYMGGIVGNVVGMGQIVECKNSGELTASYDSSSFIKAYVGGVVGVFSTKTVSDGIALRCYNTGSINAGEGYGAGIVGQIYDCRSYVMYCYNTGKITAKDYAGGIVGSAGSNRTFVMNCYNSGEIAAKNASGIIAYASSQFNETYKTQYSDVDIYANYVNNYYLSTKTADAYKGGRKSSEGGFATVEELKNAVMEANKIAPNMIQAHEFFLEDSTGINNGLPVFGYQQDKTKADHTVAGDLYLIHATNNTPDDHPYYLVNRYTDHIEDNGHKLTAYEFAERLGQKAETPHNLIDIDKNVTGTCDCTCFGGDHYFSIDRWKQILSDVENNLFGVADWSNRGEIRHIGFLKADDEQSSGSVAVTWRLTGDSKTLNISFNVMYYKDGRNDGATVHEMAHAQLLDGPGASWIVEGSADYVKHNYYEGSDRDNYKWKAEDYQAAYTPTATCITFLANQYGPETARAIFDFVTDLGGDAEAGWKLVFGATYQELWDLFGEAGKYNQNAYFQD